MDPTAFSDLLFKLLIWGAIFSAIGYGVYRLVSPLINSMKPTPPPTGDTKGAIEDLRVAYSYLEDHKQQESGATLDRAMKYADQACAKDPNARLRIAPDEDISATEMRGEVFMQQAILAWVAARAGFEDRPLATEYNSSRKRALHDAEYLFSSAAQLRPSHDVTACKYLARVCIALGRKNAAIKYAKDGMRVYPHIIDFRKILDEAEEM